MKTAISIPDALFKKAEKVAKQKKVSRSHLYAEALQQYLQNNWRKDATRRANELADEIDTSMPPQMERAIVQRLRAVEW